MTALDWITLACVAFVLYTYAGYPALIAVLARLRPRPYARADWTPTVSVVIAAYNAEKWIDPKIAWLCAQDYPADKMEIIIASDGSTDRTDELVRAAAARADRPIRLVRVEPRAGKPNALNHAVPTATGEVLVMMDIRQEVTPGTVRALCATLADPAVGVVGGEYELPGPGGAGAYWRYERWIRNQEARFDSTLGLSGCLYAIRRADFQPMPTETILDDMLVPLRVHLTGRRVAYEPGARAIDEQVELSRDFHRKVRTLAGNFQLIAFEPALLGPRNRSFFQLWSHKLFRLMVPYALAALLAANGLVLGDIAASAWPRWLWWALLAAQAGFYAGAAIGGRVKLPGPPGKLLGLCNTFVVLNWAAVVGLWRFVTARQKVTW